MSLRFESIIKAHYKNHSDETHSSNLDVEFPTIHNDKQEYVFNHDLEYKDVEYVNTISSIINGNVAPCSCDIYVRNDVDKTVIDNLRHMISSVYGGCRRRNVFDDIVYPVIMSFNEETNTIDVFAKSFRRSGSIAFDDNMRVIASLLKTEHLHIGTMRNVVVVNPDDLMEVIRVYNAYAKRVSSISFIDMMHDMDCEEDSFRAIARLALGYTPSSMDASNIQDFVYELESLARDLEDLKCDMENIQMDETEYEDEDEEYDEDEYEDEDDDWDTCDNQSVAQ